MRYGSMILVILVLTMTPAWAFNEPDSFRGIPFGASEATARASIRMFCNDTTPPHRVADRICGDEATIGDVSVKGYFFFTEDRFLSGALNFPSKSFASIEASFIERHGPPTTTTEETVQNRMGAEFTNRVHKWIGPRVSIRLYRYSGKVTEGSAYIMLNSELDRFSEGQAQERKKGASQL